jgi:hypothetical protein
MCEQHNADVRQGWVADQWVSSEQAGKDVPHRRCRQSVVNTDSKENACSGGEHDQSGDESGRVE